MAELQREDWTINGYFKVVVFHKLPKNGIKALSAFQNWMKIEDNPTTQKFVDYMRSRGYEFWTLEDRKLIISKQNEGPKSLYKES